MIFVTVATNRATVQGFLDTVAPSLVDSTPSHEYKCQPPPPLGSSETGCELEATIAMRATHAGEGAQCRRGYFTLVRPTEVIEGSRRCVRARRSIHYRIGAHGVESVWRCFTGGRIVAAFRPALDRSCYAAIAGKMHVLSFIFLPYIVCFLKVHSSLM